MAFGFFSTYLHHTFDDTMCERWIHNKERAISCRYLTYNWALNIALLHNTFKPRATLVSQYPALPDGDHEIAQKEEGREIT